MAAAIIDIPGIGPVAAASLAEHGYRTLKKLANTSVEKLASVPGFSTTRASTVIAAARELLPAESEGKAAGDKGKKGKGKDKKDKRGKKKDKKDKKKGKGKGKGKGKKDKKDKKRKKDKNKKDKKKGKKDKKDRK